MPENTKSEQDNSLFAQSDDWLPGPNTERTKLKVVSEIIAYHYRWNNRTKTLFRGPKPEFIPKNIVVSEKTFRYYLHVEAYENPIEKAREYEKIMKNENLNQNQLARRLGISRVRVNQYLRLLKLPIGHQNYILKYGKEKIITERILRAPLKIPNKITMIEYLPQEKFHP